MDPIQGIPLLDWDNNRDGILIGRVRITLNNYTIDQKRVVLDELITRIKWASQLPHEVTILTESFYVYCNKFKLKSLNFRTDGSIPDEFVCFVMGAL